MLGYLQSVTLDSTLAIKLNTQLDSCGVREGLNEHRLVEVTLYSVSDFRSEIDVWSEDSFTGPSK
jgi:hypothetical protein